jgi:hypothetical protein
MVLERRELGLGLRRVANNPAVSGNERDAAGDDLAKPIGFSIEVGSRQRRLGQQVGDERRRIAQVAFDIGALSLAHLPGHESGQRQQRERGGNERRKEDFRSKSGFHAVPDIARRDV